MLPPPNQWLEFSLHADPLRTQFKSCLIGWGFCIHSAQRYVHSNGPLDSLGPTNNSVGVSRLQLKDGALGDCLCLYLTSFSWPHGPASAVQLLESNQCSRNTSRVLMGRTTWGGPAFLSELCPISSNSSERAVCAISPGLDFIVDCFAVFFFLNSICFGRDDQV